MDADDEYDLLIARRIANRRSKARRSAVVKMLALVFLSVATIVTVLFVISKRANRGPILVGPDIREVFGGNATDDMTYKDLLVKLRSTGETVHMSPTGSSQLYVFGHNHNQRDAITSVDMYEDTRFGQHPPDCLIVSKHSTARDAKEHADRLENGMFAWGKFTFQSRHDELPLLEKARKILTRK